MNIVLLILVILLMVPVLIFALEVLFSILPRNKFNICNQETPPFVVLIPAHNESGTIQNTLTNINSQISENDYILVVADNCSDDTSEIAREYGAKVIERTHVTNRGKGYALDFGIRYLEKRPPAVVIIIDADCLVEVGALQKLAIMASIQKRPIQALYLMKYNKPQLKQRIIEFAWLVKNYVRPLGLSNAGLPCQLMGTGMAFPWAVIANASLATGHIVEDIKMGLDMAKAGYAPTFLPDACVTSTFPEKIIAEKSQKKRWEHGHLNMIVTTLPSIFRLGVIKRSKMLLAMAFDLLVPPLALLALLNVCIFIATLSLSYTHDKNIDVMLSTATLFLMVLTTFIAWLKWGRETISFSDLLRIPFYIIGKLPMYISAIFNRQKEWVRTDRD